MEKNKKQKPNLKEKILKIINKISSNKKIIFKYIIRISTVIGFIITISSFLLDIQIRNDVVDLSKADDKALFYTIRLYPNKDTGYYNEYDKYVRLSLDLIVDDFKINKKGFLDVNFNSLFTHKKYYMVYDYDLEKTEDKYLYFRSRLDEKSEAQLRLEDGLNGRITEMNYSLTPNKEYAYVLIYTESPSESNLDLIFFKYIKTDLGVDLDLIENENSDIEIDKEIIDKDVSICREYFTKIWSESEANKWNDINFMFDVYEDLLSKIKNSNI